MMRDASAIGYRRWDDEIGETAQRPRFHRVILNVIDDFVGTVWIFIHSSQEAHPGIGNTGLHAGKHLIDMAFNLAI
jgi:hypothetical protein